MNRIDRLFGYLLLLQRREVLRAADFAAAFEISRRTVYRDIQALGELGVPLVTLPGQGYTLLEGYFLPPLVFSKEQAAALLLGTQMLLRQADWKLSSEGERAVEKIQAVLPRETREQVTRLLEIIAFYLPPNRFDLTDPTLMAMQRAIHERRAVALRYTSYRDTVTRERIIEPSGLTQRHARFPPEPY